MIYEYRCGECGVKFTEVLPIAQRVVPTLAPCPCCSARRVYRDYTSTSITFAPGDVRTQAKKVAGQDFGEVMSRIHKHAGKFSTMDV